MRRGFIRVELPADPQLNPPMWPEHGVDAGGRPIGYPRTPAGTRVRSGGPEGRVVRN